MDNSEKIKRIISDHTNFDSEENGYFYYEIYTDYRDRTLSNESLKKIFTSNQPRGAFEDLLSEWALDASDYEHNAIIKSIESYCEKENIPHDEICDYVYEHCVFYYDSDDFNNELHVNMRIDAGDANYDFAPNNALNYFSSWSTEIKEPSAILWLAKQMGKSELLLSEMKRIYTNLDNGEYVDRNTSEDIFVESVIQELENNSCNCSALTFLFTMTVKELIDLKEKVTSNTDENAFITLPKNTTCGLYDSFSGGGSVFEIQLDKELNIPYSMIHDIWPDGAGSVRYDVNEVYGMTSSCWDNKIAV